MFKQLCLNRLPLCDDVLDIIKSFAFYDIQTAKTREIKKRIVNRFLYAKVSRFRPNGFYHDEDGVEEDSDNCEHWSTSLSLVSTLDNSFVIIPENRFQAVNCRICGGYYDQYLNFPVPKKIVCNGHAAAPEFDHDF
jgi:hypothetical protein